MAVLAACAETPVELPTASTLTTNVATVSVTAGDNGVALSASVLDGDGVPLRVQPTILWSSSDHSVATVSSGGFVTAQSAGTATITAATGGLTATVAVTVTNPTLDLSPASVQMLPNQTVLLSAVVRGTGGRVLPSQPTITYEILDRTVALINASTGTAQSVQAVAEGTTRVVARAGGLVDTTVVQVLRNANDLVTAVNIVPDSMGGVGQASIFPLLSASDPALLFTWAATTAGGANRCSTIGTSGIVVLASRNPSIVSTATLQTGNGRCEVQLSGFSQPGSTWVVLQVNNLIDSVRVVVRPNIASISIIPDSVIYEQSTVADQQPLLPYVVLTPRGTNICSSVQAQLAIITRNAAIGTLTQVNVPPGSNDCLLRVSAGNAGTDGSTYALLTATNPGSGSSVRDSVRLRQGAALYVFAEPADASQSLTTVANVAAGDTLRAGESRTISLRVVDRAAAPVAGATVQIVATVNGGAQTGSFNRTSVTTDTTGVASFVYTAPQVLNSNGSGVATQNVTFTISGVAGNGSGIGNGAATVTSNRVIFPREASRVIAFRRNAVSAADTTDRVTTASIPVTAADQWQYRAFDTYGNPVILVSGAPASAAQQSITFSVSRDDRARVTSNGTVDNTDHRVTVSMAGDSATAVATVGAVSTSTTLTGTARPSGVWMNVNTLSRLTTPFANIGPIGAATSYALAPAEATISQTSLALSGHPDTAVVSANLGGSGFRAYLRAMDGSQAGTAWGIPSALPAFPLSTGATGTNGRPFNQIAFVPGTGNRGTAYFITDSVNAGPALSTIQSLAPTGTITNCVGNANQYVVFSGIAISPSGTEAIVTTRARTDADFNTALRGTAADSTQFSQVWRMTLPGCTLTQLTNSAVTSTEFRRPMYINATYAVVERYDNVNTTLHSITGSAVSAALLTRVGDQFLGASADATRTNGVIYFDGGNMRFGLLPAFTAYHPAPTNTFAVTGIFSRR
ncbi:Ig-like domain-containing protein [Pseudogemmatithrix spongiicola]|uniref:Ig-like domain-containing protein n=1 Tax=Pseudogemmatithrix spongiicola TaxID=3062599 RepID=A0AA49Q885_9BACT|nr:Ig-like domain-containing protein [Gemmatimonadaceae bacterium 'strain 138']WKW16558.1 Ig-like domain-containing protein [Gemmatimonadaceae bacterium 'strain 318']